MNAPINVHASPLAGARVCLVTSGPVGSDPRLVKEANALDEAGAIVRVVATDATGLEVVRQRDAEVLREAPWAFYPVPVGGIAVRKARALMRRIATGLYAASDSPPEALARLAHSALIPAIARTAAREPADLYIAHNLAALPAAHDAAQRHRARLAFDAEDFHSGQLAAKESHALRLTQFLENSYLPRCDFVTAASPGIAQAYASACGIRLPRCVLNVFPKALAPAAATARGEVSPSLYWFSQTIGPNRGIEQVLQAIAASRSRPVLHLQGSVSRDYRSHLVQLASGLGIDDGVVFLAPVAADALARVAARYDVGLATEAPDTVNRDICLTNKIFTYLLAGTPVLATDTSAQASLAREIPQAMSLLRLADTRSWAQAIDALLLDANRLATSRRIAWEAGQTRFNWEIERQVFLDGVAHVLARSQEVIS